jgi:hypothetical protein
MPSNRAQPFEFHRENASVQSVNAIEMIPKSPAIDEGENLVTSALKNLAMPITDNSECVSHGRKYIRAINHETKKLHICRIYL